MAMIPSLDLQARKVLDLGRVAGEPPFETGTPEEAKRAYGKGFPKLQGERR